MKNALKLIESFPRGRTTRALLCLNKIDMSPRDRRDFLKNIEALAREGLIELGKDKKWRAKSRQPISVPQAQVISSSISIGADQESLVAAPATLHQIPTPTTFTDLNDETVPELEKPDPNALIRYYRSALRSDPRGAMTQSPDRHAISFQLVSGNGKWWGGEGMSGEIRVRLEHLPGEFREALVRRQANENTLAVGWPIAIGRKSGAPAIWPVGLLAAEWAREDGFLVISIETDNILVNPDWLKAAARGTAWSEVALRDVFSSSGIEGLPREEFLPRLKEAMAKSVRGNLHGIQPIGSLDVTAEGINDALAIFLPTDSTFTAGAVRNLDQIATWPEGRLAQTALGRILGIKVDGPTVVAPSINVGPLNAEQIYSVDFAMSAPLTVVTGPPGTGKSQAIVAMVASALAANQSVLVASKNHQALDAVEGRLSSLSQNVNFMVRTLNPTKEVDVGFRAVLEALVREPSGPGSTVDPAMLASLHTLAKQRRGALDLITERRRLNLQLAEHTERKDAIASATSQQVKSDADRIDRVTWISRLMALLSKWRRQKGVVEHETVPIGTSLKVLERVISRDRERLFQLGEPDDPVILTNKISDISCKYLPRILSGAAKITEEERLELTSSLRDLELSGAKSLDRDLLMKVLKHRPLWLASVLGTPKRIDLHDGLFDLVIFDEASQCDIASALPLLARARRAVIVGDDRQLAFIPLIGAAQDRNLMAAQNLPTKGMGRYAQGRVSLFDLARSVPDVPTILLRDQYRSAADIVGYINTNFYGGRLRVAADLNSLKVPKGARPGIVWTDVPNLGKSNNDQNINQAEINAIRTHVRALLIDQDYEGTIGVITPFRTQVHEIEKAFHGAFPANLIQRAELRVATVDGFQGQERDIILFSPVVSVGSPPSGVAFLQREWRRLNVAISRARAVAHIFGDLKFARSEKIKTLATLAARATEPSKPTGEGVFDSEWERIVYAALKGRGLKPVPQHDIAGRRLDFALFSEDGIKLDLEVDGRMFHQDIDGNRKLDDHWRDHQLRSLGWKVRRFWVDELKQNMEHCLDLVEQDLS